MPAEIAANVLRAVITNLDELAEALSGQPPRNPPGRPKRPKVTLISLESASGGPIPLLETLVNVSRPQPTDAPAAFKLTDPFPNTYLDAWIEASRHSDNVQFLPQAVDLAAASPPAPGVVSPSSALFDREHSDRGSDTLKLLIWLDAFHRYSVDQTTLAVSHALQASDAFAMFTVEERRPLALIGLLPRFFYLWFTALWFHPADVLMLAATYPVPIVPTVATWNGLRAVLNTRTFDEMMELVDMALGFRPLDDLEGVPRRKPWFEEGFGDQVRFAEREGWVFEGGRVRYSWPFGYVTYFVARRKDLRKRVAAPE